MDGKYRAIDVARWFLQRNEIAENEGADKMTLLKLLKLLYYAEGSYLALDKGSLFGEEILAWEHGPVVPAVWKVYEDAYNLPFGSKEDAKSIAKISEEDALFLENIYDVFGQYSAWGLRNKTHQETPWKEATSNGAYLNRPISRDVMKEYFRENYIAE